MAVFITDPSPIGVAERNDAEQHINETKGNDRHQWDANVYAKPKEELSCCMHFSALVLKR